MNPIHKSGKLLVHNLSFVIIFLGGSQERKALSEERRRRRPKCRQNAMSTRRFRRKNAISRWRQNAIWKRRFWRTRRICFSSIASHSDLQKARVWSRFNYAITTVHFWERARFYYVILNCFSGRVFVKSNNLFHIDFFVRLV